MVAGCETGTRVWCDEPGILEPNYFENLGREETEEDKGLFACSGRWFWLESVSNGYSARFTSVRRRS